MDGFAEQLLAQESEGILAWAVLGARAWFITSLRMDEPETIKAAVNEYRMDEDVIQNFINECCVIDLNAKCERKFLFDSYVRWSDANGYKYHFTAKKLAIELARFGIVGDDSKRNWLGIGVEFTQSTPQTPAPEQPKGTKLWPDET